ncbi:hypothetical protein BpHYR1_046805, partial [Brachionus plicatilis]
KFALELQGLSEKYTYNLFSILRIYFLSFKTQVLTCLTYYIDYIDVEKRVPKTDTPKYSEIKNGV